ncbi:hypothetical protein JTB14_013901 [Gonioctena quinquepunctata]|nr:hypothetical protein JTB14_013901 [Gonioctena quinquepunctata]
MVRNYKRKSQRKSWTIEKLDDATRSGARVRAAARNFGIPESTLRDNVTQQGDGNDDEATAQPAETRCLGRNPLFTKQQEQEIADHLVEENIFYGVSPRHLRRIAFDSAEANDLTHTFNKENNQPTG